MSMYCAHSDSNRATDVKFGIGALDDCSDGERVHLDEDDSGEGSDFGGDMGEIGDLGGDVPQERADIRGDVSPGSYSTRSDVIPSMGEHMQQVHLLEHACNDDCFAKVGVMYIACD